MSGFGLDYFLFSLVSSVGVLQVAAAYSHLYGLMLFSRRLSAGAGLFLVVAAFTWFFTSEQRNIPDTAGGLDGNQQALLFSAAAGVALLLTLLASSVRHWSLGGGNQEVQGLDALRDSNYLRALLKELKEHWKH